MKKFLLPLVLALAILIPTFAVEAADVPDIRQISPNNIIPNYSIFDSDNSVYVYECKGNSYNYVVQFVQMLTRNYSFKLVDSGKAGETYDWELLYTGSKRLAPGYAFHISVGSERNAIDIEIIKGLSYAGHFVKNPY